MELPITAVMRTADGHGFSFRKRDGASVAFEFDSIDAAERARTKIEQVIAAARFITIHGS